MPKDEENFTPPPQMAPTLRHRARTPGQHLSLSISVWEVLSTSWTTQDSRGRVGALVRTVQEADARDVLLVQSQVCFKELAQQLPRLVSRQLQSQLVHWRAETVLHRRPSAKASAGGFPLLQKRSVFVSLRLSMDWTSLANITLGILLSCCS